MPTDPAELVTRDPARLLRAVRTDDVAEHTEVVDPGPSHLTRAVVGLLLGAALGVAAIVLGRED